MNFVAASNRREKLSFPREGVPYCVQQSGLVPFVCRPILTDLCFTTNNRQCLYDSQTIAVRVTRMSLAAGKILSVCVLAK